MSSDIELEEIQVVEVTGRKHRDRIPKARKSSCDCCTSSLRLTTLAIITCIAIVVIVFLGVGIILMFDSLEQLDVTYSNTSVNRLAMMILGDMEKMRQYILLNGPTAVTGYALRNYSLYKKGAATQEQFTWALNNFTLNQVYVVDFWTGAVSWNSGSENNFIALLDTQFETIPGGAFFQPGNSTVICGDSPAPPPIIKAQTYKNIVSTDPKASVWMALNVPDEGDTRPMLLCFVEVKVLGEPVPDNEVYGYLVYGRSIYPRLNNSGSYVDDVPTCITMEDGEEEADKWDEEDKKAFDEVTPGTMAQGSNAYCGLATFRKRDNQTISATKGRMCPNVPLFNSTSSLMVGYMKLCGLDPKVFGSEKCMKIRVDRPMSFYEEGTEPVVTLSLLVVGMMIVICIIFVIFLDCVVLRRIESLSNVIRSQTRGHAKAQEEEDESSLSASVRVAEEKAAKGKTGKSSKTKSGTSASGTSATSDSSGTNVGGPTKGPSSAHDEIENLKRAMEQNAVGLRKRLEAVNETIKVEQQKNVRHKQAMQLLNLWCGRKDFFPGLRPNAMQLRYEPTRNLDDLLSNSLALEYLKTHCDNDRTMENLWFILDVAWLEELEAAEDEEQNPERRAQLHDVVVCAAKTIVKKYIAKDAPQQINISAGTQKKLRDVGERYSKKMFEEAVREVKLMLNTDILPRFQKTSSYSAMSETLYIDCSGGGESSSELSDETVSTAGSILTDEDEEGGVGRIFAKTFKNLHTAFDVGHDDSSSRSGSSGRFVPEGQAAPGTEGKGTVETSTREDTNSESSSEEEPPKLPEEKQEKEEEHKENEQEKQTDEEPKKEVPESTDSSSGSLSSDSMPESTSSESSSDSSGLSE